jgi:hypothetical protein
MKKDLKRFLIAMGIVIIIAGILVFTGENSNENFSGEISCQTNGECIKVDAGCCGCNEGGEAIAIHEDRKDSWEKQLEENCTDVMCPQVISNHPSCSKEAICLNNECILE